MTWYGRELRDDKVTIRRLHTLRECPKTFISQFSHDVIQLYMWSLQFNNALPDAGGINDQNALVMSALSVVRDEMQKVEMWRMHEDRTKADRKPAKSGKTNLRE